MNIIFKLRRATLLLALALPSLCWAFIPPQALIVTDAPGDADEDAVITFLTGRLSAAGYGVITNVGVPGSGLSAYKQIWDIRYRTVLIGSDITSYTAYLAAGGSLFAMGEDGCCVTRDTSVVALITAAGGGTPTSEVASQATQTVNPPFNGPNTLPTVTYAAVGGFLTKGTGAFVTTDLLGHGGGIVFGPGTLTNAPAGTLLSVLDINFMDPNFPPGVSQALTDNLIAFLAAPTPVGGSPSATPIPSSAILALIGLAGLGLYRRRRLMSA
jgi:MYXO-CTERM domain-containing protein